MSKRWLATNAQRFLAEILRDFCIVAITLEEQFVRFEKAKNISFPALKDLLGSDINNKGILWRLKDMAHHLLGSFEEENVNAQTLDWIIGFIFHETLKLKENAHLLQFYFPKLLTLSKDHNLAKDITNLTQLNNDILSEVQQEIDKIRLLIDQALAYFPKYCVGKYNNKHLVVLLKDRQDLLEKVFSDKFSDFAEAIYNGIPKDPAEKIAGQSCKNTVMQKI